MMETLKSIDNVVTRVTNYRLDMLGRVKLNNLIRVMHIKRFYHFNVIVYENLFKIKY